MSTVRRSKAMPTDGPTVKFLYTIIKQLDLKSIDWSLVANQLEISNGHAARMRYSRFKQQMEGTTSTPRSSRPKKSPNKSKKSHCKAELFKETDPSDPQPGMKQERRASLDEIASYIKADPHAQRFHTLADIPGVAYHMLPDSPDQSFTSPYSQMAVSPSDLTMYTPTPSFLDPSIGFKHQTNPGYLWPSTKMEPEEDGRLSDIVKVEEQQEQEVDSSRSEVEFCGLKVVMEPKG
ncbi:hypothetical protein ETB97_000691 [Aspergillus alliaceus]|uniref:Myb-like DNA-binding domain-containing protein n=1 Tax=Petromyces alliaceus TaxID=209559 RepID=A0A5N6FU84_PETAA|nr:uncharacterized protein BDW43DRAFT_311187 [Aspergillus alliaceus]KAB8233472.1 hypothetical protein BDW43DRAFT_311187 [Aspergillus alliaceus]KAF5866157.1 hypothetical protein ETB97_000691 [Aspergillus burnettii]